MSEQVGFIGLGIMGRGMARNLLRAGFALTVWNRTESKANPLVSKGATKSGSPADLAAQCAIIIICVSDTPDVEAVLFGEDGVFYGVRSGSLVIDCSTISPIQTQRFASTLGEKGVHMLMDALAEAGDGADLIILGDGPRKYRDFLERRVARLGLGSRVEFIGGQPHEKLAGFYVRSRVVVVPSVWPEPFGIVGIEAMAHGRPVVAFDVGGIRDWLADGETGFLVPRGDVKGLAEGVGKLVRSRDLSAQMGEEGRATVRKRFNRADHMEKLLRFYRKACG